MRIEESEVEGMALTERSAAKALGVSTKTLSRLRQARKIPYFFIGRGVRYRRSALEKWCLEREIAQE